MWARAMVILVSIVMLGATASLSAAGGAGAHGSLSVGRRFGASPVVISGHVYWMPSATGHSYEDLKRGYPPYYGPPYRSRGSWRPGYRSDPIYWRKTYVGPPLHEVARRLDPGASAAAVPAAPSGLLVAPAPDPALAALAAREYERAARLLERREVETVELEKMGALAVDRSVMRLRALALLADGRPVEAQGLLSRALVEDPGLRSRPFDAAESLGSVKALRDLVLKAVVHARRESSAPAWEMVATLMELEGRPEIAETVRRRARAEAEKNAAGSPSVAPKDRETNAGTRKREASFRMPRP